MTVAYIRSNKLAAPRHGPSGDILNPAHSYAAVCKAVYCFVQRGPRQIAIDPIEEDLVQLEEKIRAQGTDLKEQPIARKKSQEVQSAERARKRLPRARASRCEESFASFADAWGFSSRRN